MNTPTRRRFLHASCGLSALTLAAPRAWAQAPSIDARFDEVRDEIQRAVAAGQAPSIAVAAAQSGRILWEEGFGWADKERRIPASPHTRYAVASVAKPFVATGLMALVERGRVDLDRSVNDYLSRRARITGCAGDARAATVRRVLQHRAGLPAHNRFFYSDEAIAAPSMEETIRRYGILVSAPEERYLYSNLGYGIIAYITARASDVPFAEYMRANVFAPLGLTRTSLEIERDLSAEAAAIYGGDGAPIPYYVFDEWGAGRVWSTAHDLVRFGMFHLKARLPDQTPVLSDSAIDQMVSDNHTTGAPGGYYGTDWFYGLGWGGRHASQYGPGWYGHEGGMPGVSAQLKLFPDERIAIAVVSNGRQDLTYSLVNRIADALLPDFAAMRVNDPTNQPRPPVTFAPGELAGVWTGEIATAPTRTPVQLEFESGGTGRIRIGDQPPGTLTNLLLENNWLTGACADATLPTEDVRAYPHALRLDLAVREGVLNGSIRALGESLRETATERFRFNLASWISLTKETHG